jgi:hypothetical protein
MAAVGGRGLFIVAGQVELLTSCDLRINITCIRLHLPMRRRCQMAAVSGCREVKVQGRSSDRPQKRQRRAYGTPVQFSRYIKFGSCWGPPTSVLASWLASRGRFLRLSSPALVVAASPSNLSIDLLEGFLGEVITKRF